MQSNGGSDAYLSDETTRDQHCGPRFLRDALAMCDWGFRGCGAWGGLNKRILKMVSDADSSNDMAALVGKGLLDYAELVNRGVFDTIGDLDIRLQWTVLGWNAGNWAERRFGIRADHRSVNSGIFISDADKNLENVVYNNTIPWLTLANQIETGYFPYLPDSEFKCYGDLTEVERDAVRKLQITIEG